MSSSAPRQLALTSAAQILAMGLWFSASSVVPALRAEWALSTQGTVLLTASVQVGFAAGALVSAVANLADRLRPERLLAASAAAGALLTLLFPLCGDQFWLAVLLRFGTGMALAGVYPVGMKIVVSWFPNSRGLALGVLLAALALGSASPHLLAGSLPEWRTVLVVAALLALGAAALAVLFVHVGPAARRSPPWEPRYLLTMARDRRQRLIAFGYFGHMWELYAFWTWIPAYAAAASQRSVSLLAFTVIGVGGAIGCLLGGALSDRFGRIDVALAALAVSGTCCLISAFVFGAHPAVLGTLLFVWGVAAIADSGQFSAALSEAADARYVGTALTAQTAIGFLLSALTIQGLPVLADAVGWRAAAPALAVGPLLGVIAMVRLRRTSLDQISKSVIN
ncbi:MFS transporter [Amycolatopsis thailandensis]|uniref:MFS transporter n=1 Tax=Amycolatopsis thailandensis TaxID=589330 RepID=A0A229RZ28_9PSEU|nr:MFS transporter [Amycolatopsis thailandensis]OXM51785.1 MFS transporter [Amycolatopsis thailandensis]